MARKDWKKHLLRVKQIADQNLGRVEKTEALTADLQVLEKKVELYQKVYYSTGKKLQACVQGQGHDAEKRMKKLPESQLAYSLTESSNLLTIDSLLGQIFQICGDAQGQVANKRLQQEMGIEKRVLAPIHQLLEVNIPAIQKHKKALQKMVLDMDSSKTRFQSAVKQQQAGNNAAKVDSLRDEYDEACYRVDQCRDQLATEMFTLASKEAELSQILLELIKCQADFHRKALDSLEKRIPQMEEQISFWTHMPVYGRPLDDHLRRTEREIALVIEECIKNLCTLGGLEEEGLFRIAGAANKVKKLKAAFDSEQCQDIAEEYDVHCIAGSLKQYLRELPDPLMDSSLYPNWMAAAHLPADQRLQALAEVITMLPEANYNNLRYLIKFLQKLTEFQELNKMSPSNIAIVMGPNLIWPQGEGGPSVLTTSTQSAIVEALISHCEYFFPGDIDFWKPAKGQLEASTTDILRERAAPVSSTQSDQGSLGRRHGITAGLTMTHQSLVAPVSSPVARNNGDHKRERTPDAREPKVTIRVEQSPDPEVSSTREDYNVGILGSSVPVAYTSRGYHTPSGSASDTDSNGRYNKAISNGDGLSHTDPAPRTLGVDVPVTRGVTPPPKGPPPCGLHGDVYNTVFALQQLNDGCWSDYLTRVRTLWDGHMNQRSSVVGPDGMDSTDGTVTGSGAAPPGESGEKGPGARAPSSAQIRSSFAWPTPVPRTRDKCQSLSDSKT